jgi:hypothetical protein
VEASGSGTCCWFLWYQNVDSDRGVRQTVPPRDSFYDLSPLGRILDRRELVVSATTKQYTAPDDRWCITTNSLTAVQLNCEAANTIRARC